MNYFFIGSFLFLLGGIFTFFFEVKNKSKIVSFFFFFALLILLPFSLTVLLSGNVFETKLFFGEITGWVAFRIDPLSALFILILSIGGFLSALYSSSYMKMYIEEYSLSTFYFFFGLMFFSMLMVVAVQNVLMFLIVWEVMSLSSYFLVNFEHKNEEVRKSANYYLIAMQIGVAFLIAAFSIASYLSSSFDFVNIKEVFVKQSKYSVLSFILFFVGFGTKAGFVPFHTWLPKAHPAAPTGISAVMSAVMTKMGIYGILRIISMMDSVNLFIAYFVFIIGLITGIAGIINAVSQSDIKKFLAYSTVENIGIIGIALGLGLIGMFYNIKLVSLLGFLGALLHIFNHFTFKSVLFYGSGIIYSQTHTRNINKLGGLIKYMPVTAALFLISSLAISGLPLFNGFISEYAIYYGFAKAFSFNNIFVNIIALVGLSGLAFIGAIALLSFTKLYGITFLGLQRSEFHKPITEKNYLLLVPMIILSAIIVVIGLFPVIGLLFVKNLLSQFLNYNFENDFNHIQNVYNSISEVLILFASLISVNLFIRYLLLRNKKVEIFKTWDCGYQVVSSRFQYTSSSFVQPFLQLVKELVPQRIDIKKEKIYFPKQAHLKSYTHDFLERFLIQPFVRFLNSGLEFFAWIQSGNMQQYILYGLIFLLFILIWIFGVS